MIYSDQEIIEELITTQHFILYQVFMDVYKDYLGNIPKDQISWAIVNTPYIPTISVNVYLAGIFRDLDDAYNKPLFPDVQYQSKTLIPTQK